MIGLAKMKHSSSDKKDWIREVICCPQCGGNLEQLVCENKTCNYRAKRNGAFLNLLPMELDEFQKAENAIRMKWSEDLEKKFSNQQDIDIKALHRLNHVTDYRFTSQFHFFRDYFVTKHHLSGRGLEIGGATGFLSGFIGLFYPKIQMITSDVAPINIALARDLASYLDFKTDYFILADAERLPFQPNSFDFIFSSGMLHHLGNINKGISAAKTILKPGGKWYITNELAIGSLPRLFWNSRFGQKGKWALKAGIHEKSFCLNEWTQFFKESKLVIQEIYFHRTPSHKLVSWPRSAYYSIISRLPHFIIKLGLPCEVNFVLEKPGG